MMIISNFFLWPPDLDGCCSEQIWKVYQIQYSETGEPVPSPSHMSAANHIWRHLIYNRLKTHQVRYLEAGPVEDGWLEVEDAELEESSLLTHPWRGIHLLPQHVPVRTPFPPSQVQVQVLCHTSSSSHRFLITQVPYHTVPYKTSS